MIFESGKLWSLIFVVLDPLGHMSPVHLVQDLESLHLIVSLYFFFKNAEKIAGGIWILLLQFLSKISFM